MLLTILSSELDQTRRVDIFSRTKYRLDHLITNKVLLIKTYIHAVFQKVI